MQGRGGMKGASPAFACLCLKLTSQQAASGVAPGILMPSCLLLSLLLLLPLSLCQAVNALNGIDKTA